MSSILLSPLTVGSIEIKNRMAVAAMVTDYCDQDGMPTEQYIAYHEARAAGGFGLIVTEDYAVDPQGRGFWCAGLRKDEQIAPHRELTECVHAAGAKIFAQIYHCGRQTSSALIGAQPVSASALPCPVMGEVPRPLTVDEAVDVVDGWLALPHTTVLHPGPRHWAILRGLLLPSGTAGNLTSDAHLAAIAVEHGAELVSTDTDFARFRALTWVNPLA